MKNKLALMSFCSAIFFALLGVLLPPMGAIDASVNVFVAQLLVMCATLVGIRLPKEKKSLEE